MFAKASRPIFKDIGRHDKLSPWYGEDKTSRYDPTPLRLVSRKGLKKGCAPGACGSRDAFRDLPETLAQIRSLVPTTSQPSMRELYKLCVQLRHRELSCLLIVEVLHGDDLVVETNTSCQ